jgi:hypothetical protein
MLERIITWSQLCSINFLRHNRWDYYALRGMQNVCVARPIGHYCNKLVERQYAKVRSQHVAGKMKRK